MKSAPLGYRLRDRPAVSSKTLGSGSNTLRVCLGGRHVYMDVYSYAEGKEVTDIDHHTTTFLSPCHITKHPDVTPSTKEN